MNDLRDRLDRLADAGAKGIEVGPPDQRQVSRPPWRSVPALVAATALVVIAAVTAAVLLGQDDGGDDVAVDGGDVGGSAGQGSGAVVAVTYGDASVSSEPPDLELRFLDADGAVIAERSWSEVERPTEGVPGEAVVTGGLVQRVPVGELSLEATLQQAGEPMSCTQPFTAAAGDRLILRLQLGSAATACAQVESVEDWVANRTGPTGVDYIGLTQPEADDRARAAGLTTRVVATDGMDLEVTMDLRPDRLNLVLFDGVVVAAQLDGERALPGGLECPDNATCDTLVTRASRAGALSVDVEPADTPFPEGVEVILQVRDAGGEVLAEATAVARGPDDPYAPVLHEAVPAGPVRLVTSVGGMDCDTNVDIPAGDTTRVTLLFTEDETGACASVAATSAEADQLLGMPQGLPAPGFVGLSEDEATDQAAARGWTVRVLARDGEGGTRTDDYQPERVNLVLEDGRVTAVARS